MMLYNNIKEQYKEFLEARKENIKVVDVKHENAGDPVVVIQHELKN